MIIPLQPEEIDYFWRHIKPFIQKVIDRGSVHTLDEVKNNLKRSYWQCWTWVAPNLEAVVLTEIVGNECCVVMASGKNLKDWIAPIIIQTEKFAAENGCNKIYILGRKGWARIADYKITEKQGAGRYLMEKPLQELNKR
jgi:hypothetical protein